MRTCNRCGETKRIEDYSINRKAKGGRRATCKSCCNASERAKCLAADPKRQRAIALFAIGKKTCCRCGEDKWLQEFYPRPVTESRDGREGHCIACKKAWTSAWIAANPERNVIEVRKRHLKRYRITIERYDELLAAQSGLCACCDVHVSTVRHGVLDVDHDHATGIVRGLLCNPCNLGIGRLGDTLEGVERALAYLQRADDRQRMNSEINNRRR